MKKFLVSVALLTFLFVGLFGMNLSMSKDTDGKMASCPLSSNSSTFCQMEITQHIAKWQQMFQALPFTGASLLFLLGLFFIVNLFYLNIRILSSLAPPMSSKLKSYQKEHPDIVFDKLLLAFSDGILHPKIYN